MIRCTFYPSTNLQIIPQGDLMDIGVKMTVARLGTSLVMELMRMLEGVRGRLGAEGGGGGGGGQPQGKHSILRVTERTCPFSVVWCIVSTVKSVAVQRSLTPVNALLRHSSCPTSFTSFLLISLFLSLPLSLCLPLSFCLCLSLFLLSLSISISVSLSII